MHINPPVVMMLLMNAPKPIETFRILVQLKAPAARTVQ
jgi:hypothetical protein